MGHLPIPPKKKETKFPRRIVKSWTFGTATSWNLEKTTKKHQKKYHPLFQHVWAGKSPEFRWSKANTKPSWTRWIPMGFPVVHPPKVPQKLTSKTPMMSMMKSLHFMGKSHNIPMISMMKFLLKVECSLKSDWLIPWISGEISIHWLNSISGHPSIYNVYPWISG